MSKIPLISIINVDMEGFFMRKNLLVVLQCLMLLTGCNTPEQPSYQIKIIDIDGQEIGFKNIEIISCFC